MIAASEPLEFVPHGRTIAAQHPTKIYSKGHSNSFSENSLLYKLTNFAIKDESLLGAKEADEQEWWCVREVYYRSNENTEDDPPQLSKENKYDYGSESFRPPSRLKNDFNISIKSELIGAMKRMDTDCFHSAGPSHIGSANSSSNMSKKFNLACSPAKSVKKPLNFKTDCAYEEELYVKGCTAIWSKGLISTPGTKLSGPESRETICCYTLETPIKHAHFCTFHVDINNTMLIDALNSQIGDVKKNIKIEDTTEHVERKVMPAVLLMDNKNMRVFATDGREYINSIPFQVKKVWPMKYGVLLEKEATPLMQNSLLVNSFLKLNESHNSSFSKSKTNFPFNMSAKLRAESISGFEQDIPLPTCFSLSHPLDEVTPILMKSPALGLQFYNDGDLQIIFVSTNPSIILLYDWKLATHSLWKIRKATRDECLAMCPNVNSTTAAFSQSCDFVSSPMHSNVGRNATSWATGVGSPYQSKRGPLTPSQSRSRLNSPMANMFHQQGMSPHASIGQASSVSMMANTIMQSPPSLPLYPDICLDHIWTDNQQIRRDPVDSPSELKTFLHTDLVGHDYLCFIVKVSSVSRLQIVRLQKSHSHGQSSKSNLMVGSVSSVLARDAVVLDHLKMMALIDEAGNIILQSGNNVVGKVHVGGVLARLIDSPYTRRNTFQSPFPRRSSLLPTRNDTTFDDSALHLLSPVPHSSASRLEHKETLGLRGLCDAVGSRLTLQFDSGVMYRISLPALSCSTLVTKCCDALKAILPKDISTQVIIRWYGVRNVPGTQDLAPEQEWLMFSNLLFSLIGYDVERLGQTKHPDDQVEHTEVVTKKQRTSSDGTQDDWEYLLNSKMHKAIGSSLANMLHLHPLSSSDKQSCSNVPDTIEMEKHGQFNTNCLLFPYTIQVLYAFHLVYEEIKLNTLLGTDLKPLSAFLYQISKDLKFDSYVNHYWLDFPTEYNLDYDETDSQMSESVLKTLCQPSYFSNEPPNIFGYINMMLKDIDIGYYPYLVDVNNMSRDIIEVLTIVECGRSAGVQTITSRDTMCASSTPRSRHSNSQYTSPHYQAVSMLQERGMTPRDVDNLPPAIGLLLLTIFTRCKAEPPVDWPVEAYNLVMREDLSLQAEIAETIKSTSEYMETLALGVLEKETAYTLNSTIREEQPSQTKSEESDTITGMEQLNSKLLSLLYPHDHRMAEIFNLLQSSIPVTINLTQRPEVSDHDFIEEQEKYLFAISTRTMALPVARGMLTLRSMPCSPTEPLHLPKLCVSGRGPPPRCNTINLGVADTSPQCLLWPTFHNGVAAGLALVPTTGSYINSSWIIYNKPRGTTDMSPEHAGFLMALGLGGHLRDMPFVNMYEYLVKCQEMISVGLLIGLAATYRGTMDVQATKMMSIHLEPLLPPTSIELDFQQNILVAALLGVGLIYQDTGHTHYAQVLLNEIGKPPGPEMENCAEREGYALAAGLALGLVCVRSGHSAPDHIAQRLRTYMLGGDKHPLTGFQKEKYKQGSFAIREGATVNLDVTSPGATVALGLIFMRSNCAAPAAWLAAPTTPYQLDFVRPDLLMLRIIARGLVLWDSIEASEEWIRDQVPATIKPYCFVKPTDDSIDYEAMNQAYCNIIAGASFALGLRFAGSGDEDARDAVLHHAKFFLATTTKSIAELAGRSTLETCLCVCLLAAGMIMSGRGDVRVLRLCRRLRARAAPAAPALTHGGQMAVHCTIGLLFLGGCRATLSTTPTAIAALLAAFFPKFPTHSEDNRYHLQAFRHLYVLAVEARLILPRDLSTGKLCYAHIQVIDLSGAVKEMKAPCIIPELETLKEVKINDPRYWPITFQRGRNWDLLKVFLEYTWCIDIKQRAGCLSYLDDPHGFLTILAQTLTLDKSNIWSSTPENIDLFTNDEQIQNFVKNYLKKDKENESICGDCLLVAKKKKGAKNEPFMAKQCLCRRYSKEEQEHVQALSMVTYECVVKDMLCALPIWTTFLRIVKTMKTNPTSYQIWQIKLLLSQIENQNKRAMNEMKVDGQDLTNEPLISTEFSFAIKQKVSHIFDSWEVKIVPYLRKYLGLSSNRKISSCEEDMKRILSAFLVCYDLPKGVLRNFVGENDLEVILGLEELNLTAEAVSKIEALLR
ncbi:anaphase-promoting complex subunit 1 [Amyelois transitella]|uniref:anaphase-promoting complex subunit 1 n=1 Tax=Amyelois transitella TaxID=680683 RepID=UPI00067CBEB5|nr:anaphase-promoting complex subunit 1 [Amyelois transitella]